MENTPDGQPAENDPIAYLKQRVWNQSGHSPQSCAFFTLGEVNAILAKADIHPHPEEVARAFTGYVLETLGEMVPDKKMITKQNIVVARTSSTICLYVPRETLKAVGIVSFPPKTNRPGTLDVDGVAIEDARDRFPSPAARGR